MKIAACFEYDGSRFRGWQIQAGQPTVQAAVETALSKIANHPVRVHCAGRTDTGVHASGQIVHFESASRRSDWSWVMGTNSELPNAVSLLWVREMEPSFHARFSALSRRYRYVILNRRVRPSYLARRVGWYPRDLDAGRMRTAAASLIGRHDFSAFRSARCGSTVPMKTVSALDVGHKGAWFWVDIEANGFLHHMVRNIIGVLLMIGCGDRDADWAREVLEAGDRTLAGATAVADGLYFVSATYADQYRLPDMPPPCNYW